MSCLLFVEVATGRIAGRVDFVSTTGEWAFVGAESLGARLLPWLRNTTRFAGEQLGELLREGRLLYLLPDGIAGSDRYDGRHSLNDPLRMAPLPEVMRVRPVDAGQALVDWSGYAAEEGDVALWTVFLRTAMEGATVEPGYRVRAALMLAAEPAVDIELRCDAIEFACNAALANGVPRHVANAYGLFRGIEPDRLRAATGGQLQRVNAMLARHPDGIIRAIERIDPSPPAPSVVLNDG